MPEYIYLIHPYRHGFFENPTPAETGILAAHDSYLHDARERGTVLLVGPCLDGTFGLIIFQAGDEAEAQNFFLNDPAIKDNLFVGELHPFQITLSSLQRI